MVQTYDIGRTSKIPNPPRTAVLPPPKGSQEKPILGSKLRGVGFDFHMLLTGTVQPGTLVGPKAFGNTLGQGPEPGGAVKEFKRPNLPCASLGSVNIS